MRFKELFNAVSSFFRLTSEEAYMREHEPSQYDGAMTRCEHVVLQADRNINGADSWTVSLKSKTQGIGFGGKKFDVSHPEYECLGHFGTRQDVQDLFARWDENPAKAHQEVLSFIASKKLTSPSKGQGALSASGQGSAFVATAQFSRDHRL